MLANTQCEAWCAMGHISTHVLDTVTGRPASGISIELFRITPDGGAAFVHGQKTNEDGRTERPLLEGEDLTAGTYVLEFHVDEYFRAGAPDATRLSFFDVVPVRFKVTDASEKHHVPLLLGTWSYTVYRGS